MRKYLFATVTWLSTSMPATADPVHCEAYSSKDIYAMAPTERIEWLSQELTLCEMSTKGRARTLYFRGSAHDELREWVWAIEDYTQAITLHPDLPPAVYGHRGRALCFLEPPRLGESLADIQKAATMSKEFAASVQTVLMEFEAFEGPATGEFGPATQEAWVRYCAYIGSN